MFFVSAPNGEMLLGDSEILQAARDRGEDTIVYETDHRYVIKIDEPILRIIEIDGRAVKWDSGKPVVE